MNAKLGWDNAVAAAERLAAEVDAHKSCEAALREEIERLRAAAWDARLALDLALLANGLSHDIKNRLRTAWRKVGDALGRDVQEVGAKMNEASYRDGIERAANEVQIVCDRLYKTTLGEQLSAWIRGLPDDPAAPHPESPRRHKTTEG